MHAYGLDAPLAAVAAADAFLTVFSGDSGTGKSRLLAESQQAERGPAAAAPDPVPVRRSAGSLQAALVDALAAAVAESATDVSAVRRLGERVVAAARAAGAGVAADLAKAVAKEVLAALKARVGPEAGDALAAFAKNLASPPADEIALRLRTAHVPGAFDTLAVLAGDVAGELDRIVVLALDNGDLLPDDDVRLLADLAERELLAVRLRVAWSTAEPDQEARVRILTDAGAHRVDLTGLPESAVADWVAAEGHGADVARAVHRASAGYPLLIEGLLGHLADGGAVDDYADDRELVGRLLEDALDHLDVEAAHAARKLSVFHDPLTDRRAAAYLGLDPIGWAETQRRLVSARVLTVEVSGRMWFHEQRRRHLWRNVVTDEERGHIADAAVAELEDELAETGDLGLVVPIARTARHATGAVAADPHLAAALAADPDEIAVAAALIELAEHKNGSPAVLGEGLLLHARDTYRTGGDLIDALGRLQDRGLVHVETRSHASAVIGTWGSPLAAAVLAGRAAGELGRLPVPAVASRVFSAAVLPRISPFRQMAYGVGDNAPDELAEEAFRLRGDPATEATPMRGWPALLLRGRYGDQPVYAAVTYTTEHERDQALARVDGLNDELLGKPLHIHEALAHPAQTVPSLRWARAASLVAGTDVIAAGKAKLAADPPLDPADHTRRSIDTLRVIRERATADEQRALGLAAPTGYAIADTDSAFITVEITGRDDLIVLDDYDDSDDPYHRFRLAHRLRLPPGQAMRRITRHWPGGPRTDDPAVAVVERLRDRAACYNRRQNRVRHLLTEEHLQPAIAEATARLWDDARALAASVPVGNGTGPREEHALRIVLELTPPQDGLVAAAYSTVTVGKPPGDADDVQVRVIPKDNSDEPRHFGHALQTAFGLDREHWAYQGDARQGLARLLGHADQELAWAYTPDDPYWL